jgi:hypothetical protein
MTGHLAVVWRSGRKKPLSAGHRPGLSTFVSSGRAIRADVRTLKLKLESFCR